MTRPPSRGPRPSPGRNGSVQGDALPPVFSVRCRAGECVEDASLNHGAHRLVLAEGVRQIVQRLGAAAVATRRWQSGAAEVDGVTWLLTAAPVDAVSAQVMVLPVSAEADPARVDELAPEITPREREVLLLSLRGRSPRDIAAHLDISWHTVRTHVKRAYRALGVSSRAEAIALVVEAARPRVRLGLIASDDEPGKAPRR